MSFRKLLAPALAGAAALALSACATGLPTQVSRYQAMPAPAGQSFYIVPASGGAPTLEFGQFASQVARHLEAKGYRNAGAPQLADMIVKLDYGVDEGRTERVIDPMARSMYADPFYRGYYDPFYRGYYGRPYYSRYGYYGGARSPFYYGWDDPYWYASPYSRYSGRYSPYSNRSLGYGDPYGYGYGAPIREYTVYKGYLDLDIVRRADNAQLFDGKAQARAQTDETGVIVPNLIEAMFTGFPGRSGETVRITVPARKTR